MRKVNTDCIYFNGYKPCRFHKENGTVCANCLDYKQIKNRILIIKLGAGGEVIRNTPLLHKLRELYPDSEITWITHFPEFVPSKFVDRIMKYTWENVQRIFNEEFDLLLSLDKEYHACAVANHINAKVKKGFLLDKKGKIIAADKDAENKWLTGIFDDLMKINKKHYVEELFEICGWKWAGERYIIEDYIKPNLSFNKTGTLIGLNTGAGPVWTTRIWPEEFWLKLILHLKNEGLDVILLGGQSENDKNLRLTSQTGAFYEGVKSLKEFVGIVDYCDIIVTSVTMALHIGIGLNKRIVLLNNIFNKNEFYLYDLGVIIEPDVPCKACYKQSFDRNCPVENCMTLIKPDVVFQAIMKQYQRL